MTQNDIILRLLKRAGKRGITPADAMTRGVYRLSARVYDLRRMGHNIQSVAEMHRATTGKRGRHARYILESI